MAFDEMLAELSVERAWGHLTHITEHIPTRLAGSQNSRRMAEYAAEQLERNGLQPEFREAGWDRIREAVYEPDRA